MLCGFAAVYQASVLNGVSFDPFSFQEDGLATSEVDVGGGEVGDALVVPQVIVVRDEVSDFSFEIAGQIIVLEQNAVLQGEMPTLDLALGLWMIGRATDVLHVFVIKPFGEIS